ncbi:DUF4912 domain-containing protein [Pseudothermotoga thermarum]|uniref:DUF4912 domain-containing protein n=1 Tax=Pseudothermotoga thermarum DSM 5069 TaxID=688269 RepID=F7YW92_9THEM|nr:DUF4912 domain-containing protein [Pseudothermotoga thermarum]AEH51864.1 hypothetical protein Theth_1822 [Pseudothermotoga thermarum DSM 5069]
MTRKEILDFLSSQPSIQSAKAFAKKLGLKVKKRMKKQEVYKMLYQYADSLKEEEKPDFSQPVQQEGVQDIPTSYGSDRLVLLAVNPYLVHVFWDLSFSTYEKLAKTGNVVLRLYDVTFIIFDGTNAHRIFEAGVHLDMCKNYYFKVPMANADYLAELGYKKDNGEFIPVLRSNICRTPSAFPSSSDRQRWYVRGKPQIVTIGEVLIKPVEKISAVGGSFEETLSGRR